MFRTTNYEFFTDGSLENTIHVIIYHLKFCLDICCPTETTFVSLGQLTQQLKRLRWNKRKNVHGEKLHQSSKVKWSDKNLEFRRLNSVFTQKIIYSKHSPKIGKLLKELPGTRHIRSDNWLSVCDS